MTTELETTSEGKSEIVIAIIDEAYDNENDDYEQASLLYKASLEDEFSVEFEEGNVGPGADIPAFITVLRENALPLLPWLLAVFFSGKPIVDNLGAWRQIFASVRKFCIDPVKICSCYKGESSDECDDGRQHQAVDGQAKDGVGGRDHSGQDNGGRGLSFF
jgi:hypothetical protein